MDRVLGCRDILNLIFQFLQIQQVECKFVCKLWASLISIWANKYDNKLRQSDTRKIASYDQCIESIDISECAKLPPIIYVNYICALFTAISENKEYTDQYICPLDTVCKTITYKIWTFSARMHICYILTIRMKMYDLYNHLRITDPQYMHCNYIMWLH